MGYFGGCRSQELLNMKISDIEDRDSVMVVNVPESKTGVSKKFTIVDEKEFSALPLLRLYMSLRPKGIERFFLRFRQNKCTSQPIGKNMFGKIPSKIAMYLGLPNPSSYTGHCLRRTSATALANAGATMTNLKRHGGWKSSTVAEGYLEDSIELRNKTARMLSTLPLEEAGTSTVVNRSSSHTKEEIVSSGGSNFQGTFQNCTFIICNDANK
uniref:Tyr recombinase domain-containing protein n=2 Tax=Anoplophora glabripennis TaxID=217634 RepID=V5I8C6_ANOGL